MLRDEKIFKYSIAVFLGFLLGAIFWSIITYKIMRARFYDDLKADHVEIQERNNAFEAHLPEVYQWTQYFKRLANGFETDMNKREKMILTRDMPPNEIIIEPSEKD